MHVIVGTKNAGKIAAVKKWTEEYPILADSVIDSCDIESGVHSQPVGLDAIVTGAKNRAFGAYNTGKYDLAFGIESGIFAVPYTKSGFVDTTCCVIYDGEKYHVGFSSCFEYPKKMIDGIFDEGKEISDIAVEMGFAENREFRQGLWMVWVLTKSRVTRIDYTYQAVQMALLHLENPEYY